MFADFWNFESMNAVFGNELQNVHWHPTWNVSELRPCAVASC